MRKLSIPLRIIGEYGTAEKFTNGFTFNSIKDYHEYPFVEEWAQKEEAFNSIKDYRGKKIITLW